MRKKSQMRTVKGNGSSLLTNESGIILIYHSDSLINDPLPTVSASFLSIHIFLATAFD